MTTFHELRAEFPELANLVPWSVEWYRAWREQHAAKYPDADQGTRDNLDMFVARAEESRANMPNLFDEVDA